MLEVIKPGFYTSVQDLGRWNYRDRGMPSSGVMDEVSAAFANALLNNNVNDALLEITQIGPHLRFHKKTIVAFSGALCELKLNGDKLELNKAYVVEAGDELKIGYCRKGIRLYMAIKGGFQTEVKLQSRSWIKDVYSKFRCEKGDALAYAEQLNFFKKYVNVDGPKIYDERELIVTPGPEFHLLSDNEKQDLLSQPFTISNLNNRMAYNLEEKLQNQIQEILSVPVLPGTVQLTSGGSLMILMKDSATTGGYPRVLQLSHHAVAALSQKSTREIIRFKMKH